MAYKEGGVVSAMLQLPIHYYRPEYQMYYYLKYIFTKNKKQKKQYYNVKQGSTASWGRQVQSFQNTETIQCGNGIVSINNNQTNLAS